MLIKTIRWKNLLSTGNTFTEIELDKTPNALIIGDNGAGKSTILDALTFSLFGKAFRNVNKPLLVNSINEKNCEVQVEFTTNGKDYKVVRGIKPNIFEIYTNGKLINQDSSSKDYQEYLEKFILNMNYKSFTQIVILGSASFTPFMQLSPADRRIVIEDLLDIQIFSIMNTITKQKYQANREEQEKIKILLSSTETQKNLLEKNISLLRKNNQEKVAEITKQVIEYEQTNTLLENEISLLDEKRQEISTGLNLSKLKDKHLQLVKLKTGITGNHQRTTDTINFFNQNDNCPTCYQSINIAVKQIETNKLNTKLIDIQDGLIKINLQLDKVLDDISLAESKLQEFNDISREIEIKKAKIGNNISYKLDLEKQAKTIDNTDILLRDHLKSLEEVQVNLKQYQDKYSELLEERKYIDTALTLLKDGGIKTKIIKQYIPIINKHINKYLQQMNFFVNFSINENFEETIKSRHRDTFSYENFSEGEKMRIDLAILFTWRAIAKIRNSTNCNILFFDEIFDSSLDANGTEEFLKIIMNLTSDTNTFIISHKQDQLMDKFQKVHRFKKVRGFSVLGN